MKPEYFSDIEIWDFSIYFLYFFLVYVILIYSSKYFLRKDNNFIYYYYLCILSSYTIILSLDLQIKILPSFPDTIKYSNYIKGNGNFQYQGFEYLAFLFKWLSFNSVLVYLLFNLMITQIGIMMVWKAWLIYNRQNLIPIEYQRVFLILSAIYPLAIIYSLVPLRESYFIIGMGLFLIGIFKKKIINIPLLIGIFIIFLIREHYILFVLIVLFIKYSKNFKYRIILYIGAIPLIFAILDLIAYSFFNISITPEGLAYLKTAKAEAWQGHSAGTFPPVNWNTWFDVFIYLPKLFLQFLFAPFPIIVKTQFWTKYAYFIDGIYVTLLVVLLILHIKKIKNYKFWILIFIIYIGLSSMYEFLLSGAVRHRYFAVLMILPLVSSLYRIKLSKNTFQ
ncbi:MAG: hypothetical protein ACOCP8_09520 [archaeon]